MSVTAVAAVVQVGDIETAYFRAGHGAPLILVTAKDAGEEDPIFLRLAESFRVFAPLGVAHVPCDEFEIWLMGFIDGLGLQEPRVIVEYGSATKFI